MFRLFSLVIISYFSLFQLAYANWIEVENYPESGETFYLDRGKINLIGKNRVFWALQDLLNAEKLTEAYSYKSVKYQLDVDCEQR